MENKTKEFFEKHKNDMVKMKEQLPDVAGSFSVFFGKVMKDGALSLKEKELIAVAIGSRSQMQVLHSSAHEKVSRRRRHGRTDSRSRIRGGGDGRRPRLYPYSGGNRYVGGNERPHPAAVCKIAPVKIPHRRLIPGGH